MHAKNGFLLIELMLGLMISIFFILIITHYIIEVKITQQQALKTIEIFSLTRNQSEKIITQKNSDTNE
jgi:Tfp pilus assembly protein PilW